MTTAAHTPNDTAVLIAQDKVRIEASKMLVQTMLKMVPEGVDAPRTVYNAIMESHSRTTRDGKYTQDEVDEYGFQLVALAEITGRVEFL